MKSLVVGAMFLQSIHAQFVPATGADPLAAVPAAQPASVLTPDTNDFIIPPQPPALADAPALQAAPLDDAVTALPAASLDDAVPALQAAPVDGAVTTPEESLAIPETFQLLADNAAPVGALPLAAAPVAVNSDPVVVVDPTAIPIVDPIALPLVIPSATPIVDPIVTPIVAPISNPITDTISIIVTPTVLPGGSAVLPIGVDPNSIYDPNSPYYDPYAQPPGWEGEDNGIYDGEDDDDYHGGKKPVKKPGYGYDDEEECPSWCHSDSDYSPYEPTPTPDYDYSPYKSTPTPEYDDSPYKSTLTPAKPYKEKAYTPDYEADPEYYPGSGSQDHPQLKKVRSILRAVRRQVFKWPQPTYNDDDDDTGAYEGEDGSIPDWLYDISGAPKRPVYTPKPKPECPKSCYKHYTTDKDYATKPDRPTYTYTRKGGYKTTEEPYYPEPTEEPYYPEPTKDVYYGDVGTNAPYKPEYTSNAWYPQGNSSSAYWPTGPTSYPDKPTTVPYEPIYEPTVAPYEPTVKPYEPTTLATYYQQPQPYPEQTGGSWSDPGSPAGDYTGDTLDTLCPNTCNPFNPAENFCDVTTGCATTGGSKYYCACRAGYRADNYNAKDFSKQFKVAGQPYVYLAVSTSCNTLCSDQTCSEVLERSQCK